MLEYFYVSILCSQCIFNWNIIAYNFILGSAVQQWESAMSY